MLNNDFKWLRNRLGIVYETLNPLDHGVTLNFGADPKTSDYLSWRKGAYDKQ